MEAAAVHHYARDWSDEVLKVFFSAVLVEVDVLIKGEADRAEREAVAKKREAATIERMTALMAECKAAR